MAFFRPTVTGRALSHQRTQPDCGITPLLPPSLPNRSPRRNSIFASDEKVAFSPNPFCTVRAPCRDQPDRADPDEEIFPPLQLLQTPDRAASRPLPGTLDAPFIPQRNFEQNLKREKLENGCHHRAVGHKDSAGTLRNPLLCMGFAPSPPQFTTDSSLTRRTPKCPKVLKETSTINAGNWETRTLRDGVTGMLPLLNCPVTQLTFREEVGYSGLPLTDRKLDNRSFIVTSLFG